MPRFAGIASIVFNTVGVPLPQWYRQSTGHFWRTDKTLYRLATSILHLPIPVGQRQLSNHWLTQPWKKGDYYWFNHMHAFTNRPTHTVGHRYLNEGASNNSRATLGPFKAACWRMCFWFTHLTSNVTVALKANLHIAWFQFKAIYIQYGKKWNQCPGL